jgi:hypothetical protein
VVGDTLYGGAGQLTDQVAAQSASSRAARRGLNPERLVLGRNFLHAAHLEFPHPRTGKLISLEAPLPPDLESFLTRLEAPGKSSAPPKRTGIPDRSISPAEAERAAEAEAEVEARASQQKAAPARKSALARKALPARKKANGVVTRSTSARKVRSRKNTNRD